MKHVLITRPTVENFSRGVASPAEKDASLDRLRRFAKVLEGQAAHSTLKDSKEKLVVTCLSCELRIANAVCCGMNKQPLSGVFRIIMCSRVTGATVELKSFIALGSCSKELQEKIQGRCVDSLKEQSHDKGWNAVLVSETDAYGRDVCIVLFTRDIWDYLEASDPSLRGHLPGRVYHRLAKYGFCPMYEYLFKVTRHRLELWVLSDAECDNIDCTRMGTKLCTGCRAVYYCSVECSKTAWPYHKSLCKKKASLGSSFSARIVKVRDTVMEAIMEDPSYETVCRG